jgi:hypothetical protein
MQRTSVEDKFYSAINRFNHYDSFVHQDDSLRSLFAAHAHCATDLPATSRRMPQIKFFCGRVKARKPRCAIFAAAQLRIGSWLQKSARMPHHDTSSPHATRSATMKN